MTTINDINNILEQLKIKAECIGVINHKHITICNLKLSHSQRIRKIELNAREIGLALKSKTTPIINVDYESGLVKLEFATRESDILPFDSLSCDKNNKGMLPFVLGEKSDGNLLWVDMAMNPHLLIAGGTGSGKSTLLHTIISNAIKRDDVWLYLVDPKHGVEFDSYNDKSTFMAKNYNETIYMLEGLFDEMERRYEVLSKFSIRSIEESSYLFPKIMVIIDEVADLMMIDQDKSNPQRGKFENLLCTIAQKSRAAGIYCVLATQRPSVGIITGLIKANFPARIACKVSSGMDSKVILDKTGAENLLGRGDAIINNLHNSFVRFQVAYSSPY